MDYILLYNTDILKLNTEKTLFMFVANNTISNIKMVKVAIGGVFQPRQGERDKPVLSLPKEMYRLRRICLTS